jgi:hypothetical protein
MESNTIRASVIQTCTAAYSLPATLDELENLTRLAKDRDDTQLALFPEALYVLLLYCILTCSVFLLSAALEATLRCLPLGLLLANARPKVATSISAIIRHAELDLDDITWGKFDLDVVRPNSRSDGTYI